MKYYSSIKKLLFLTSRAVRWREHHSDTLARRVILEQWVTFALSVILARWVNFARRVIFARTFESRLLGRRIYETLVQLNTLVL